MSLSDENLTSHARQRSRPTVSLKHLSRKQSYNFPLYLNIQVPAMYVKQPFHVQQYFDRAAHHGVLAIGAWSHNSKSVQSLPPPCSTMATPPISGAAGPSQVLAWLQLQEPGRNDRSDGGLVCATRTPRHRSPRARGTRRGASAGRAA